MYFFHGVPSHSISEKVGLACQASSTAAVVVVAAGVVAVVRSPRSMKSLLTMFVTSVLHSL